MPTLRSQTRRRKSELQKTVCSVRPTIDKSQVSSLGALQKKNTSSRTQQHPSIATQHSKEITSLDSTQQSKGRHLKVKVTKNIAKNRGQAMSRKPTNPPSKAKGKSEQASSRREKGGRNGGIILTFKEYSSLRHRCLREWLRGTRTEREKHSVSSLIQNQAIVPSIRSSPLWLPFDPSHPYSRSPLCSFLRQSR